MIGVLSSYEVFSSCELLWVHFSIVLHFCIAYFYWLYIVKHYKYIYIVINIAVVNMSLPLNS